MPEYSTTLTFTKQGGGGGSVDLPIKATVYVMATEDLTDCFFTGLELPRKPKFDGMEDELKLQEPRSETTRTWIGGKGTWSMDEDDGHPAFDFTWQKFIFKEVLEKGGKQKEAMAWMSVGEEGKETVITTENWKD